MLESFKFLCCKKQKKNNFIFKVSYIWRIPSVTVLHGIPVFIKKRLKCHRKKSSLILFDVISV